VAVHGRLVMFLLCFVYTPDLILSTAVLIYTMITNCDVVFS